MAKCTILLAPLLAFIIAAYTIDATSPPKVLCKCAANEEPGNLKCNRCEPTCARRKPEACTKMACIGGCSCDCKKGFVRDVKKNKCVPEDECPAKYGYTEEECECPENEEEGTMKCNKCEPTCAKRKPKECTKMACPDKCSCNCKKGFVRDVKKNKCVPEDECPARYGETEEVCEACPLNEEPGNLKCNGCEPSCKERDPKVCNKKGCDKCACNCKKGYFRNEKTGLCVLAPACPVDCKPCPANEQPGMSKCNNCEPTCDLRKPLACTLMACTCSCDCKPGFFRNKAGECVPEEKCPPVCKPCPPNEQPGNNKCNSCEPTCDLRTPGACTKMACPPCSCDCKKGFFRNKAGECVPEEKCPPVCKPCPDNEEPGSMKCNKCEPTCAKRKPKECTKMACPDKCACNCKAGFFRDVKKNKCVPDDQCPARYGDADEV